MSDDKFAPLYAEVDKLLSELQLGDPADRLTSNPSDPGTLLLDKGMLEEAVDSYRLQAEHPQGGYYSLHHALYGYVLSEIGRLDNVSGRPEPKQRPTILISIPVWGAEYIRTMLAVLIPTLMAPENVPALARNNDVVIEFSTKASEVGAIEATGFFKSLEGLPNIRSEVIGLPDAIFSTQYSVHGFTYRILGAMQHLALHRARFAGNTHVVFLGSDFILSDGILSSVMRQVEEGYGLVLTAPMKVATDQIIPALLDEQNEQRNDGYLSVKPGRLVELGFMTMHPESRQLIVSNETKPFSKAPFPLYFPKPYGYSVRSFMFHPLVASAAALEADIMYDYNTVDGVFLDRIVNGRNPSDVIKVLDDSGEGVFFDVCAPRTTKESEVIDEFSLPSIIEWLYQWRKLGVEPVYKWLLTQPVSMRTAGPEMAVVEGDFDEDMTIAIMSRVLEKLG